MSPPTASLEDIMATLIKDDLESRSVSITDVTGAHIHAEMPPDKKVLRKLKGEFVDIMCEVNGEYKEHVRYEDNTKLLCLKVLRAIYGYLESVLLWYNLYLITLQDLGFS